MATSAGFVESTVTCQDDGSWSYTWMCTFHGYDSLSSVQEAFNILDDQGQMIDFKKEDEHRADPGQNYSGGGSGNIPIPPGNKRWQLLIIAGDQILGIKEGSFVATTNVPN